MGHAAKKTKLAISNLDGLEKVIEKIGKLNRKVDALQGEMNAAAAKVSRPFLKKIAEHEETLAKLNADAVAYCEVFRNHLLGGTSSKTVQLTTGKIQFKAARSRVVLEMDENLVIARLHEAGHDGAIRIKHSVDKTYVLKFPEIADDIDGLRIEQGTETVAIKPTTIS